jgi:hypothetical protein
MKSDQEKREVRMELKYCERCGGLWARECGAGVVYCGHCQPKVGDLPVPMAKKRTERVILPVRRRTVVERYEVDPGDGDEMDFEAMGGAA